MSQVYLNGNWLPIEQAQVSVLDRGFIFGDGVYEVIPVYGHKPLALEDHLARLDRSLAGIAMHSPFTHKEWAGIIQQACTLEGSAQQSVYIQITRGIAPRDHAFPIGVSPTVFVMAKPMAPPPKSWLQEGVFAVTHMDFRWDCCHLKTTALLANVLLRQQAVAQGAVESVLLRAGYLTEGAASNMLVVSQGIVLTPPRNHHMLTGITLELILRWCTKEGVSWVEGPISEQSLRAADELLMTSSTREIIPIVRLDGAPIGTGAPGPMFARLLTGYQSYK
ncbi:MAG: D-amino acid aminotransferase [Ferrovum sp.]|nr:D-amino acid aminotransferase [Ferrovum sp.]